MQQEIGESIIEVFNMHQENCDGLEVFNMHQERAEAGKSQHIAVTSSVGPNGALHQTPSGNTAQMATFVGVTVKKRK